MVQEEGCRGRGDFQASPSTPESGTSTNRTGGSWLFCPGLWPPRSLQVLGEGDLRKPEDTLVSVSTLSPPQALNCYVFPARAQSCIPTPLQWEQVSPLARGRAAGQDRAGGPSWASKVPVSPQPHQRGGIGEQWGSKNPA